MVHFPTRPVFWVLLISMLAGCAGSMTADEAKEVAITLAEQEPYTPPPRRIYDILAVLEAPESQPNAGDDDRSTVEDSPPPVGAGSTQLYQYFREKGFKAWDMGRENQALEYLRKAQHHAEGASIKDPGLMIRLGRVERTHRNFRNAVEILEKAHASTNSLKLYNELVSAYAAMGDLTKARRGEEEATKKFFRQKHTSFEGFSHIAQIHSAIFELEGKWKEAEEQMRKSIGTLETDPNAKPLNRINRRLRLGRLLILQERFLEAEFEIRQALTESIQNFGKRSTITWKAVESLVDVVLAQGRVEDAEKLARAGLRLVLQSTERPYSPFIFKIRMSLANVLATKGDFLGAVEQIDLSRGPQWEGRLQKDNYARMNLMLALVMGGRIEEGAKWIGRALESYRGRFGSDSPLTAEMLAMQGLAEAKAGKQREALTTLGRSLPIVIERVSGQGRNFPMIQRLKVMLETYLALLSEIHGGEVERELGINAAAEAFRVADVARSRSVHTALAASSARAAVTDPKLAELIRREQDVEAQIASIQDSLVEMLAAPQDQEVPALINDLRGRIENLTKAKTVLMEEIQRSFPKYSNFVSPEPPTVDQVRKMLRSTEALLSIYVSQDRTFLWAMRQEGPIAFGVSPIGKKELSERVARLRGSLDCKPHTLGDIPPFDLTLAHEIFKLVIQPVEPGWKGAEDLLVIAGDPLGQIPLALLPTAVPSRISGEATLFQSYRSVPWLIRSVSVASLPSTASFINLRSLPVTDQSRKTFAGFGDPIFRQGQAAYESKEPEPLVESRGKPIRVRGIRTTQDTDLDNAKTTGVGLSHLNRLPDTAEEIRSICGILGADPAQDAFLGEEASESRVKGMDLSPYQVVAFATHALVPGDLDGLDQPALALSSPAVTGEKEDGLLTMGEVLKLKMNADWVVLSACNTGAGQGEGAEAVSGLGRAFFYAGTRALLVSMWPVESTSARLLTTGLFRHQQEEKSLSRSQSLRKSILDLVDREFLKEGETGRIVASYAHPMFWAPFVMVGASGSTE